jgi:hypothetical protein
MVTGGDGVGDKVEDGERAGSRRRVPRAGPQGVQRQLRDARLT